MKKYFTGAPSPAPILPGSRPAIRLTGLLSILYSVFVIYGSLVPLHYVGMPLEKAIAAFRDIPFLVLGVDSRADWVANLLLFIPLSFLYNQLATTGKTGIVKHLISLVILAVTVSLAIGIEFTQLFFPHRTVSQNDIWAEGLGSVAGISCQYLWGGKCQRWLENLWRLESGRSRLKRALHVYLAVLFAFNVLPLDLTISPVELYHKWAEGRVVLIPFSGLKGGWVENLYETLTDLLIWVPAGLLWALDSKRPILRVAAMGLLAAAGIEAAQLFVYSRVTDVTDVLLAGMGTAAGALITQRNRLRTSVSWQGNATLWFSLWATWALAILAIFWFPYDFDASRVTLAGARATLLRPLLENYYFGSEYHATNELLRKIGFFLPAGILWGFAIHQRTLAKRIIDAKGGLLIFALALLVEFGQLYLPKKYADLTDVLIQTAGGLMGLAIARWVLSGHTAVTRTSSGATTETKASRPPNGEMGKTAATAKWLPHLAIFFVLALAVGTITHLPFAPYNIKELIEPGISGIFSIIGLSLAIQWLVNGHFLYLQRCDHQNGRILYLPLWLLVHGGVTWVLLRLTVPMESIYDIVGSPVMEWFWEWELIGRYLALHSAIALQILGAIILTSIMRGFGRLEAFLAWATWSAILAWPLHWIVVNQAATDNLTELMREGGTFFASTLLAFGFFSLFLAGSTVSSHITAGSHRFRSLIVAVAALSIAALCFWFGSEPILVKYDRVFSAWQFILSENRENYATGVHLFIRFAAAIAVFLGCWSLIQAPLWRPAAPIKHQQSPFVFSLGTAKEPR